MKKISKKKTEKLKTMLAILLPLLLSFCLPTVRADEFGGQEVTGLFFPVERVMIAPDEEYALYPGALPEGAALPQLQYTSSNERVAKVLPSGVVVGIDGGDAVITAATMDGRYSAQCRVTVSYRESSQYSWLILLIIFIVASVTILAFWFIYRRYIREKEKRELGAI